MSEYSRLPWWKEVDPKGRLFGDGSPLCLVKCSGGIVAEIVGNEEADLIINAANSYEQLLNLREIAIDIEACLRSEAPVPEFMQFAFSDAITATQEAKSRKELDVSEWMKARKTAIAHYREARPEDEEMIRRREGEALSALGIDESQPVHPHYLVMRGGEGEEYPISREVFSKTYESLDAEVIVCACNSHKELLAAVGDALEIITWMSGSDDFSQEGQAHGGWVKAREKLGRMFATYYKAGGTRE